MNNSYLCRAKKTKDGKFVSGYPVLFPKNGWAILSKCIDAPDPDPMWNNCLINYDIDFETICKGSDVTDIFHNHIYENDIVKDSEGNIGVVKYGEFKMFNLGFYIEWVSESAYGYRNELLFWASKVSVIGNIFDNSDIIYDTKS